MTEFQESLRDALGDRLYLLGWTPIGMSVCSGTNMLLAYEIMLIEPGGTGRGDTICVECDCVPDCLSSPDFDGKTFGRMIAPVFLGVMIVWNERKA